MPTRIADWTKQSYLTGRSPQAWSKAGVAVTVTVAVWLSICAFRYLTSCSLSFASKKFTTDLETLYWHLISAVNSIFLFRFF